MTIDASKSSSTYTVRSNETDDSGRLTLVAARDKILASAGIGLELMRQWPNDIAPTRLLVSGDAETVFDVLREFFPIVHIEENMSVRTDL